MRRRLPLLGTVLGLCGALLLAGGLVLFVARIDRVVVARGVLAGGSQPVHAPRAGIVAEAPVGLGQRVEQGEVLFRLRTEDLEAQANSIRARIEALEHELAADRERGRVWIEELHPAERREARRSIERARIVAASTRTRAELLRRLVEQGLGTEVDLADAERARDLAEVDLAAAEQAAVDLERTQTEALAELDRRARVLADRLSEERAQLEDVERRLAESVVRAPVAGVVIGEGLEELAGRAVSAGEEVLRVAYAPARRFEGRLDDAGRAAAQPGAPVRVRLAGYPWLLHGVAQGRLRFVAARRGTDGGFSVVVDLERGDGPGPLYEGMRGEARILVEEDVSLGRVLVEKLLAPSGT